mmetsp:Transcript_3896/g.10802  ORF Transcript_3896/g.10802 Transcript_3896/m.10802 type:complete len:212 (+) Transcript_3896:241-876(+)
MEWHMRTSSACAFSCCSSFSFALCLTTSAWSLSWACWAFSTATAKIKLMTSKLMVTRTIMKYMIVTGSWSTTGNTAEPQESPAMIPWMIVRLASHTFRYDFPQRSQPASTQSTFLAIGWINCTATSAKTTRTPRRRTRPQHTVRTVPAKPMTITCNSGKRMMTWYARASRIKRMVRNTEMFGMAPTLPRRTVRIRSRPTTVTSTQFQKLRK